MSTEAPAEIVSDNNAILGLLMSKNESEKNMGMQLFIEKYESYILRLIRSRGIRNDDKDDVLQSVYVALTKAVNSEKNIINLEAWITTTTLNQSRMHQRTNGRNARKMRTLKALAPDSTQTDQTIDSMMIDETRILVRKAVGTLEPSVQDIVWEKYELNRTEKQTAKVRQITPGAVNYMLTVAKKTLRNSLIESMSN